MADDDPQPAVTPDVAPAVEPPAPQPAPDPTPPEPEPLADFGQQDMVRSLPDIETHTTERKD